MSCGCNNLNNFPRTCGVDPCLVHKTSTDLVFYTGDTLSCTEIEKCDNATLALQKIDTKLCPESITNAVITAIQNNVSLQNIFCTLVTECIPTTTSTSTSSSTSTTTSSSTTLGSCKCFKIYVDDDAAKPLPYTNCNNEPDNYSLLPGFNQFCASSIGVLPDKVTLISADDDCIDRLECPTVCYLFRLTNNTEFDKNFVYFDCEKDGVASFSSLSAFSTLDVCSLGEIIVQPGMNAPEIIGVC